MQQATFQLFSQSVEGTTHYDYDNGATFNVTFTDGDNYYTYWQFQSRENIKAGQKLAVSGIFFGDDSVRSIDECSGNATVKSINGNKITIEFKDFNFERQELTINKSYQRLNGRDVITTPKTKKSNRTIKMPKFLCEEMQEYIGMLYEIGEDERLFQITKSYLHHEMDRGAKAAGVKRIRIHDLRHSAISLLIEMGFSALAIAERVGHESIDITYRYAHLFPTKQTEMADKLDVERMEGDEAWTRP